MNLNIDYYLRKYDGFLSHQECNQVIDEIEKQEWTKHSFYLPNHPELIIHPHELDNLFDVDSKLQSSKIINERISRCFQQYINDHDAPDYFGRMNASSYVRFNRYKVGQAMTPHVDHIHTLFMKEGETTPKGVPILSMVGSLNDDYEGGEFVMWENRIIPIPKGSVIIFPSNFLYPHHVEFVKKGTRHTFVSWAW